MESAAGIVLELLSLCCAAQHVARLSIVPKCARGPLGGTIEVRMQMTFCNAGDEAYGVVTKAARQLNHSIQGAMMCRMYVKLRSFSLFEFKQITEACDLLSACFFFFVPKDYLRHGPARQRLFCGRWERQGPFFGDLVFSSF